MANPPMNTTSYSEFIYFRTKPSLRLQLPGGDDNIYFRMANRVNANTYVVDPDAYPGNAWSFPNEWVVDNLYYETWLAGAKDSNGLSLKLGRQDFLFLNGMAIGDSTPGDGSRTLGYYDGASATWKQDRETVTAVAFYDKAMDWLPAINRQANQDPRAEGAQWKVMRPGDIQLYGANWNHVYLQNDKKKEVFGQDLYGFYIHNQWRYPRTHPLAAFQGVPEGATDNVALVGSRLYGSPHPQVDLSAEIAGQAGRLAGCTRPTVNGGQFEDDVSLQAYMVDLRMTLKAPPEVWGKPALLTEYTVYSGDQGNQGRYSGWMNYYNQYPIWNDELFGFLNNNFYFTNMQQLRFDLSAVPYDQTPDKTKITDKAGFVKVGGLCDLIWPASEYGGNGGYKGTQLGLYADYKPVQWCRFTGVFCWFIPGDYYITNDPATTAASPWRSGETTFWASLATYIYF